MTYTIHGKRTGKQFLRVVLLIFGLAICFLASQITWVLLILGLYIIFIAFTVKVKTLLISQVGFQLIGKSWIPLLSTAESFKFCDIKSIRFDKAFNDLLAGIILSASAFPITTTKPDTIEILKKDGSFRSIGRIGKKKDFIAGFKVLLSNFAEFK